jgi:DNA-binding PadR family transcriptional regulator
MNIKGFLPVFCLHILSQGANYGYGVSQFLDESGISVRPGNIYPVLAAFLAAGWVDTYSQQIDGRNQVYYKLTPSGWEAYNEHLEEVQRFLLSVFDLMGGVITVPNVGPNKEGYRNE